jgi:hypothetical protein
LDCAVLPSGITRNWGEQYTLDATAFANTALETFDRTTIIKTCMSCHNVTGVPSSPTPGMTVTTDLLWSLNGRAFPAKTVTPNLLMQDPTFRELRSLMEKNWNSIRSTCF